MGNILEFGTVFEGTFHLWAGFLNFSQTAAATLVTAVWQGAVVAVALGICLRVAPRASAAHRFAIWAAGFMVIAGLPFLPLLSHFSGEATPTPPGFVSAQASSLMQLDIRWSILLTGFWIAASLFRAVGLCVHSIQLRKLWKSASPVELPADCASLPSIPGRKSVELCTSRRVERPSVIGFLAPRILIPEWLFEQLLPAELDQIVLHETEHLRRGDDWTNLLQKFCLVLFPLNPALLWVERQLCLEREMACDDGVIRRTHAPRAYAACLTSLAERGLRHRADAVSLDALSLGAWQRRPELVRRVHSVLLRKQVLGTFGFRSLLAGLGLSLVLGAVELAQCPQLVAFVPEQNAQAKIIRDAALLQRTNQRMAGQSMPGVVQTAIARLASSRSGSELQPQAHVTYLKAELPPQQTHSTYGTQGVKKLSSRLTPSSSPRQVMLKAKLSAEKNPVATEPAQTQAWIVLTTWEQVEQVEQPAQETVEADNRASDRELRPESGQIDPMNETGQIGQASQTDQANQAMAHRFSQVVGKITITRMIFRVLPTSSASQSPAVSARTGWLLFQL